LKPIEAEPEVIDVEAAEAVEAPVEAAPGRETDAEKAVRLEETLRRFGVDASGRPMAGGRDLVGWVEYRGRRWYVQRVLDHPENRDNFTRKCRRIGLVHGIIPYTGQTMEEWPPVGPRDTVGPDVPGAGRTQGSW